MVTSLFNFSECFMSGTGSLNYLVSRALHEFEFENTDVVLCESVLLKLGIRGSVFLATSLNLMSLFITV